MVKLITLLNDTQTQSVFERTDILCAVVTKKQAFKFTKPYFKLSKEYTLKIPQQKFSSDADAKLALCFHYEH